MIKIFKFGGASVKDAVGVRNLASVIKVTEEKKLLIVGDLKTLAGCRTNQPLPK